MRRMYDRLAWQTIMPIKNMVFPIFEKMYGMAFDDTDPTDLKCRMDESINPFVLAYDKPF